MPADYLLIDEPYPELNNERKSHNISLRYLKLTWERMGVLMANGVRSPIYCKLCVKPPQGVNVKEFRENCPCHFLEKHVEEVAKRLRQVIKRNKHGKVIIDSAGDLPPAEGMGPPPQGPPLVSAADVEAMQQQPPEPPPPTPTPEDPEPFVTAHHEV